MQHSQVTPYAMTAGGVEARLDTWLRIPTSDPTAWLRRAGLFLLVAYVIPVLFASVMRLATGAWDPWLLRLNTHVAMLISAPLLFYAERAVDERAVLSGSYLVEAEIVAEGAVDAYRAIVARTARLRDSRVAELVLLLLALGIDTSRVLRIAPPVPHWGGLFAVALFRFLLLRWLWRWLLWALFLRRVSRLPLALSSLHPDRAGGLGVLMGPSEAFSIVAMAGSAALAAGWAQQIYTRGARLEEFYPIALTYVLVLATLAALPLLSFTDRLYELRRRGLSAYGALVRRYCSAFERKWLGQSGEAALGSEDISALADAASSYEVVSELRPVLLTRRLFATLAGASVLPMVPLLLTEVSFASLVLKIVKALTLK